MHSSVRSVMRKHIRMILLVSLVISMLLYIVSQDIHNNDATLSLTPKVKNSVTLTLIKEEVLDILNEKDDVQAVVNKEEKESIGITEQAEKHVQYSEDRLLKNKEKKDNLEITEQAEQHVQKMEDGLVKNDTKKHQKKEKEFITEKDLPNLLSKYAKLPFVVVNNKVIMKKDLNSSAAQEALVSASLAKRVWPPVMEPSGASLLRKIDLSNHTAEDRSFLESRMEVYEERARHAGIACSTFPDKTRNDLRFNHLVWDTKHTPNIVFCPNYKVASTTWMTNFLRLVHFNENNPEILKLRPEKREKVRFTPQYGARQTAVWDYYKEPSTPQKKLEVFKQALRVIIVRHPFTRILSAYRDKMVKMKPKPVEFKFRELQLQIIAKYRKSDSEEKSPHPTFPEFIQHVIDSTADLTTSMGWQRNIHCWTPYWSQCEVCFSDFNFIMKLETMVEDERFLITMSDLKELKELKEDEWKRNNKYAVTSYDVAPKFYQQITQEQMRLLYQRYKLDFDIFDYNIDDYLAIAKDVQLS